MRGEVEFAEEGIHEVAPFIIVGLGERENYGHVRLDIDSLKNGDRWREEGAAVPVNERPSSEEVEEAASERSASKSGLASMALDHGGQRSGERGAAIARKRFRREPTQLIPCRKYN
jgi:hypothetical protein